MKIHSADQPRIMLCLPLAVFGLVNIVQASMIKEVVRYVLPGDVRWWFLVFGIALIITAIIISARKFEKQAALAIALALTLFIAIVYVPNLGSLDQQIKVSSIFNMGKDMILAAGALTYSGLASVKM